MFMDNLQFKFRLDRNFLPTAFPFPVLVLRRRWHAPDFEALGTGQITRDNYKFVIVVGKVSMLPIYHAIAYINVKVQ